MKLSTTWRILLLISAGLLMPRHALPAVKAVKVVVLKGEGAFNDVRGRRAINPEVEVRDEQERPLANARVTFTMPFSGAGGSFGPRGDRAFEASTNVQGRAVTEGLIPNAIEGRFSIVVEARYEGLSARALIHQSNTTAVDAPNRSSKRWMILSTVAGAGLTAAVLAARSGGGGSSPAQPAPVVVTTVSIASVTIGGPR